MKLSKMDESQLRKEGYIEGAVQECLICGTPTPFIEICSEGHFCSTECVNAFYNELLKAYNRTRRVEN